MSVEHIGTMGIFMTAYDKKILSALEVSYCLEALLDRDIRLSKNLCNKVLEYIGLGKKRRNS
jgi:predicted nucleic acid-binding protein